MYGSVVRQSRCPHCHYNSAEHHSVAVPLTLSSYLDRCSRQEDGAIGTPTAKGIVTFGFHRYPLLRWAPCSPSYCKQTYGANGELHRPVKHRPTPYTRGICQGHPDLGQSQLVPPKCWGRGHHTSFRFITSWHGDQLATWDFSNT